MSKDENSDQAVTNRESVNHKKTTRSRILVIPLYRLKHHKTGGTILDSYDQAVTLTAIEDKFTLKIEDLNELQLLSNNSIPCVDELVAAHEAVLVGSALGGVFLKTS